MDNEKKKVAWPFWLQIPTLCFIGIIILWIISVSLNPPKSPQPNFLETIGVLGLFVCFFACVPVGIIGTVFSRKKAERMEKFRKSTRVLSVINIVVGAVEILTVVLILSAIINNMGNFPR